jgi:hypothetical protein
MADEDHRNLVTIVREDADEHLTSQTQPTDRPERAIHVAYLEPISARGSRICMGAEQIILGRSPNCTVQLEDPRVSGRHALLQVTETGVLVNDLGSTNGTFVDGHRVDEHMRVTTTALLLLGRTIFRILLGDEPSEDGSPKARLARLTKDRAVYEYEQNGGNLSHTARLVGFDRQTVRGWLRERGVYREPNECNRRWQGPHLRTTKR